MNGYGDRGAEDGALLRFDVLYMFKMMCYVYSAQVHP